MQATRFGTIEVSADLAEELIPILEEKITGIQNHITSLDDECDGLKGKLAELRAKLSALNGSEAIGTNGFKKRLPKGHAATIVFDLLKSTPNGLPIKEIVSKTGVSYGSVFRTLKDGRFAQTGGLWKAQDGK